MGHWIVSFFGHLIKTYKDARTRILKIDTKNWKEEKKKKNRMGRSEKERKVEGILTKLMDINKSQLLKGEHSSGFLREKHQFPATPKRPRKKTGQRIEEKQHKSKLPSKAIQPKVPCTTMRICLSILHFSVFAFFPLDNGKRLLQEKKGESPHVAIQFNFESFLSGPYQAINKLPYTTLCSKMYTSPKAYFVVYATMGKPQFCLCSVNIV